MVQRRFGPTLGAGVAVIEADAEKPIQNARLGVTGYSGIVEKGPVNKIFAVSRKSDYLRRAGSYIPESQIPNAAFDFYNLGAGAGELHLLRITDGTHRVAEVTLFSRHQPVRREVLKVTAAYVGEDNPGRWAGKAKTVVGEYAAVTQTTLSTGKTMLLNELKGAVVRLSAVPGKSYKVISNSTAGVLTFDSDVTLVTDINGSTDLLYSAILSNDGKAVGVRVLDGEDNPTTEFGLEVYVDGVLTNAFRNLSMDPASPRYALKVVNQNSGNFEIKLEDLNVGTVTPATRPASWYGTNSAVTALVLTAKIHEMQASVDDGDVVASIGTPTYGASIIRDTITLTCVTESPGAAVFEAVSAVQGALPDVTEGTAYPGNVYSLGFTLANTGSGEFTTGDVIVITLDPFPLNAFAGLLLVPDYVNNRRAKFVIASNTASAITVKTGQDMTTVASTGEQYMVEANVELGNGYDGVESIVDASYLAQLDGSSSPWKSLFGKNKGLVKLATPGVTSTQVQKAGLALAEALNWQYRVEIPANIVTEDAAEEYINATIGRSDFGKVHFPSYAYVANPLGEGEVLVTQTGAFHGREAREAKNFDGYHKVAGGTDTTLPNVIRLPTGDRVLDEELLNPVGINVVKFRQGTAIMWGARTISIDPAFKFANHREQLSHYENVIRENFDFIIFAINNSSARERLRTSLISLFLPEFTKGALSGNTFEDAASFKLDDENNTALDEANGDLNAEIKLKLAGTVERFVVTIGKAGIFESLAA